MNRDGYTKYDRYATVPRRKAPPPKSMLAVFVMLPFIIMLSIVGAVVFAGSKKPATKEANSSQTTAETPTTNNQTEQQPVVPATIRLVATGDVIPHDSVNKAAKKSDGSYDYKPLMANMKPVFQAADIRFCNQSVLGGGTQFPITGYPTFNSPSEIAADMKATGCNLVNTGSNHTNDKPQNIINASVGAWDKLLPDMLAATGTYKSKDAAAKISYFEVKGVKFAFLSYVGYTNETLKAPYVINMFNETLMKTQAAEANKYADVVIASMRWGTEYSQDINADQSKWAQFMADQGVDILVGHGPHVLEPVKKLKGKGGNETYVWFSLGNFLNTQLDPESLFNGFAVMDIDATTKKVTNLAFLPLYMHYEWTAAQKAANDLEARKNVNMYLFDNAESYLKKSQLNTTLKAQTDRITKLLNKYTKVTIYTPDQYYDSNKTTE